jgi:hypothetical protein
MPKKQHSDCDPYLEAYRAAKAKREAAMAILKRAKDDGTAPGPELVEELSTASKEEFGTLAALLSKPRKPLFVG